MAGVRRRVLLSAGLVLLGCCCVSSTVSLHERTLYVSPDADQTVQNTVMFHDGDNNNEEGGERAMNEFMQLQRRMRRDAAGSGSSSSSTSTTSTPSTTATSTTTRHPPLDEEKKKIIPKVIITSSCRSFCSSLALLFHLNITMLTVVLCWMTGWVYLYLFIPLSSVGGSQSVNLFCK